MSWARLVPPLELGTLREEENHGDLESLKEMISKERPGRLLETAGGSGMDMCEGSPGQVRVNGGAGNGAEVGQGSGEEGPLRAHRAPWGEQASSPCCLGLVRGSRVVLG